MKQGMMTDSPEMATLYDLKVREGDLVILGTDGERLRLYRSFRTFR